MARCSPRRQRRSPPPETLGSVVIIDGAEDACGQDVERLQIAFHLAEDAFQVGRQPAAVLKRDKAPAGPQRPLALAENPLALLLPHGAEWQAGDNDVGSLPTQSAEN